MSVKYKLIIDPNTNTAINPITDKKYDVISGDYLQYCHKNKFYTPCGECRVLSKKRSNAKHMYPLAIKLNFKRLPCVRNENVSSHPYLIHGFGKGLYLKKLLIRNKKFNGYVTRGCIGVANGDIPEVYNMLAVGDRILIKSYNNDNIKKYMRKHCSAR